MLVYLDMPVNTDTPERHMHILIVRYEDYEAVTRYVPVLDCCTNSMTMWAGYLERSRIREFRFSDPELMVPPEPLKELAYEDTLKQARSMTDKMEGKEGDVF